MRICSFENAAALIVLGGLVFAVIVLLVMSMAVKVFAPAVFAVIANVLVPATRAALVGRDAFASELVMSTVPRAPRSSLLPSTALFGSVNAAPAVCALGLPVLPEAVPGAAVSPGRRICS